MPAEPENLDDELSAYLDGELPPERVAAVRAQLERSADARGLLAALTAVSDGLRALPHAAAPAGLGDAVCDEVAGRVRLRIKAARRRKLWWWSSGLSAAALLALAVLVGRERWLSPPARAVTAVAAREMPAAGSPAAEGEAPPASPEAGVAGDAAVVMAARDKATSSDEPAALPPAAAPRPLAVSTAAEVKSEWLGGGEPADELAEFRLMPAKMEQYATLVAMLREWVLAGLATQEVTPASDPQIYVLASPAAANQIAQLVQTAAEPPAQAVPGRGVARTDTRARSAGAASQPATAPVAQSQPTAAPVRVIIHRPSQDEREN